MLAEKELGGSIYIVNKPGAAEATGPNAVMNSKADGYTIGNLNYGSVVNAVYQGLIPGYDLSKLNIFALVTKENDALMVGKGSPYKTFDEFIAAAKANPGRLRIGDQGIGSRVYLLALRIEEKYGVKFNMISYKGSAAQREAIVNNEIDAAITSLGDFAPLLKSGEAIGLVEFSTERNPAYPLVPTCIELGIGKEMLSSSFICMAAPKDTPEMVVARLVEAFEKATNSDEFQKWVVSQGVQAPFMKGEELSSFIKTTQETEFKALDSLKAKGIL